MRQAADIRALVAGTVDRFGRVDCLVNNAGQDFNASVEEIDPDDYRQILELNLLGALQAMQAVSRSCASRARARSSTSAQA